MKLRFYIDKFSGPFPNPTSGVFAMTSPGNKVKGCRRIAFDVTIPDHMLFEEDFTSPEVGKPELVADQEEGQ